MNSTWENFKSMLDDIKLFLKENSNMSIVQNDNPLKLVVGYRCEQNNKEWNIKITDLKNSIHEDQNYAVIKSFQTEQGKNNLLKVINSWSKNENIKK